MARPMRSLSNAANLKLATIQGRYTSCLYACKVLSGRVVCQKMNDCESDYEPFSERPKEK